MTSISDLEDLLDVPVMDVAAINRIDELIEMAWTHWDADQPLPLDLVTDLTSAGVFVDELHRAYLRSH